MVFDVKMHLALHVDVLERHGRDVREVFRGKRPRWRVADDSLHRLGVPGHDDGNRGRFLCVGSSQINLGVIHTAGDSFWLRPGC